MVSTFTPFVQLEEPARGDQTDAWATPVNAIMTCLDLAWGGTATITVSSVALTLASSQYKCKTLTFQSTLTTNVVVTLPTSFIKSYEINNLCTGTSLWWIVLGTSGASNSSNVAKFIGCPPGETVTVFNDGYNITYTSLDRVGTFWDYAGAAVPPWVAIGNPAPYQNCDGTSFSSATYPALTTLLGGTTLPDTRGRCRWTLNQATGRITAGIGGVDGNTNYSGGGNEFLHSHNHGVSDPSHNHVHNFNKDNSATGFFGANASGVTAVLATINSAVTGITINNTGAGASQNMPPAYVGGLTLIRAA